MIPSIHVLFLLLPPPSLFFESIMATKPSSNFLTDLTIITIKKKNGTGTTEGNCPLPNVCPWLPFPWRRIWCRPPSPKGEKASQRMESCSDSWSPDLGSFPCLGEQSARKGPACTEAFPVLIRRTTKDAQQTRVGRICPRGWRPICMTATLGNRAGGCTPIKLCWNEPAWHGSPHGKRAGKKRGRMATDQSFVPLPLEEEMLGPSPARGGGGGGMHNPLWEPFWVSKSGVT